jgi:hypothetical protein
MKRKRFLAQSFGRNNLKYATLHKIGRQNTNINSYLIASLRGRGIGKSGIGKFGNCYISEHALQFASCMKQEGLFHIRNFPISQFQNLPILLYVYTQTKLLP